MTFAAVLTGAAVAACLLSYLWESRQWVAFYGSPGHRSDRLFLTARDLRRAGVRCRVQNVATIASMGTMGAGVSTTLLVHKKDLTKARRAVLEARAKLTPVAGKYAPP